MRPSPAQEGLANNSHSMTRGENSVDGAASIPSMAQMVTEQQPYNSHSIQTADVANIASGIAVDGSSAQHLGEILNSDNRYL